MYLMSTRNISRGGKGSWCTGLTTLPLLCANCLEIWEPQPPGTLRACPGLYRYCYAFALNHSTITRCEGTRWGSWLRHCATSRKVAGSIPDGIIRIFHWHNPSRRSMALGLTQRLTEMNTRNISWAVKVVGVYGWQPYHLHVPTVLKSRSLKLLEPSGSVQDCNGIALSFTWPMKSGNQPTSSSIITRGKRSGMTVRTNTLTMVKAVA